MEENATYKDDLDWVQRILESDAQAWNRFVEHYSDRILKRAWELCREARPKGPGRHWLPGGRIDCDDCLEIYVFIFDYLYNRRQRTGKLKFYDGRSRLDTFVIAVLRGHLRDDWVRHKRRLRVDQITRPPEIKKLSALGQKVFDQMVLQHRTETIAGNLGLSLDEVEKAQARVTHELMAHDHLPMILRRAEEPLEEDLAREDSSSHRILPMRRALDRLWEKVCLLIGELPQNEKILLDMVFDQELDAESILRRCEEISLPLPVQPRTGRFTIHSIYQSVDVILKKLGNNLQQKFQRELADCRNSLDEETTLPGSKISSKGLKVLLENMGITMKANSVSGPYMAESVKRKA
jgi:hypothetical protein